MINFIFGNHGSGKTSKILDMLKEDALAGRTSLLIVPEQEAVQAERLTLEALPSNAQLSLEVLNFSRLYNRVCREYGGLCYSYITTPMKHITMWKALRETTPLLTKYSSNAENDSAFVGTMLSAVLQLKSSGISVEELENAANECSGSDSELSARLMDISRIWGTYDLFVNEVYSDSADDLSRLCEILDEHDFFKDKNVYIDSFSSFTAIEHRVIEKIFASAKNTTVTICLPSPQYSDISTESIEKSLKVLKKNANKWGGHSDVILSCNTRSTHEALFYLSNNLWRIDTASENSPAPAADGHIVAEICDSPYAEAEAVASHILELTQSGARYRDIVIIARDAEKYRGILEPALMNAGINFFFSQKTDLCALAPVKFIMTAIRIKQYGFRKNDVISHIKTGMCSFTLRESDIFEEYVNTWNISGSRYTQGEWTMNPDGFSARISERGKAILTTANDVRERLCEPLQNFFSELDMAKSMADICRAIYRYTEKASLREKCNALAERELSFGNKKAASELLGVYDVILKTLADIGEALSDVAASVDDFYSILKIAFEQTEIGTIPTSIDEVTVGSASMLRSSYPKYVFVIGLCEGEFPKVVDTRGLFGASDLTTLEELGIELGDSADIRSSNELLFVKNAFAAPSERLYVLYHTSDLQGSKKTPSLPFNRIFAMFSDVPKHKFDGSDLSYLAGTPTSAATHLRNIINEADRGAATLAVSEHLPLVAALSCSSVSTDECRIDKDTVKELIGDKIYVSPSSLERYVSCPFSYYASYVLALREPKLGRFAANHVGDFVHFVMEHLVKFMLPTDVSAPLPTHDEILQKMQETVDEYIRILDPDGVLKSKRMEHLYKKLYRLSLLIIETIAKEFSDSDFRPAFFELKIDGKDGRPEPLQLTLENNARLVLRGYIDRVDIWRDGEDVFVRILDYKTGSKQFNLSELSYGINIQMLLYLMSICANPGAHFREVSGLDSDSHPIPAGIVYLSSAMSKSQLSGFDVSDEEILEVAESKINRSGLILNDERLIHAISHSHSKDILLGVTEKNGVFSGKALVDIGQLGGIFDDLKQTLVNIGNNIYSGIADCSPMNELGQDPCHYCTAKQICRKNIFETRRF